MYVPFPFVLMRVESYIYVGRVLTLFSGLLGE